MKVVWLGAWCEFSAQREQALSFDVSEFAVLADGRRLTLHAERCFTTWEWLAGLLRAHGIEASPADLKDLPYDVEFGPRVRAMFGGAFS